MLPSAKDKSKTCRNTMLRTFVGNLLIIASANFLGAHKVLAQEFWSDQFLLDVYTGSHRSSVVRGLSKGGYELSGGEFLNFRDWYTPKFQDTTILFLKQVSPDLGIIWGLSTGEDGVKYSIEPALQLGFVYQYEPFENALVQIKTTYPLFGRLVERSCVADYGELGGVQAVNCRLAAETLPPEETLDYLVNIRGETDARINIVFSLIF